MSATFPLRWKGSYWIGPGRASSRCRPQAMEGRTVANTQQPRSDTPAAGTWQYHSDVVPPREMKQYERTMNTMGADGWELVAAYPLSLRGAIRSADGNTTDVQVIWKRRMG